MHIFALLIISFSAKAHAFSLDEIKKSSWTGTIGSAPVNVCFESGASGQYYYKRYMRLIRLGHIAKSTTITESTDYDISQGVWDIKAINQDELNGTFTLRTDAKGETPKKKGTKTAIKLKRVADNCDVSFYKDAEDSVKTDESKFSLASLNLVELKISSIGNDDLYKPNSLFKMSTFKIESAKPGAPIWNKEADAYLAKQARSWLECKGQSFNFSIINSEPVDYLPPLLTVKNEDASYCGGAYQNYYLEYKNFDLDSGLYTDIWNFIKSKKASRGCGPQKTDCYEIFYPDKVLAAELNLQALRASENCEDAYENDVIYSIHAVKNGLVFRSHFAHVIQVCERELLIEYPRIERYITAEGINYLMPIWQKNALPTQPNEATTH